MSILLISLLSISLEAGPSENAGKQTLPADAGSRQATNSAIAKEYEKLQAEDDAAQAEIEQWIRENSELRTRGGGISDVELKQRNGKRVEPVRKAYEAFLIRYPNHARAHLAFGSFLADREDEAGAQAQWEKALELDPKLPDAYNNLAGIYTETGQVKKAFDFFSKAIELNPTNATFYHNFGDSVYVLRKGVVQEFGLTEQQVYAKSLQQYSNAVRLDPKNFLFASDLAQTYYAITPLPIEDALTAWTNALAIAGDQSKCDRVRVHLARVEMLARRFTEARAQLEAVTSPESLVLKSNLLLRIKEREASPSAPKTD